MIKRLVLLAIALFVFPIISQAQGLFDGSTRFEGLLIYRVEMGPTVIQQKAWVRGDSVMMEAHAPMPVKSIVNFAKEEYRVYQDESNFKAMPVKGFDPKYVKTSNLTAHEEYQTINGRKAQLFTVEMTLASKGTMRTEFWLTKEFSEPVRYGLVRNLLIGSMDPMFRDIAHEIYAMGMAPVALGASINGKKQSSMQLVTATEQTVPDEKFSGF
jgi:hypothetical protein